MSNKEKGRTHWAPSGQQLASGVLEGQGEFVEAAGRPMLRNASRRARIVASHIPGLPGLTFDGVALLTAEDRAGAGAEFVGGMAGSALGGAVGGPLGAAVGSVVGQKAGEFAYDHRDDIRRGAGEIKDWMTARRDQIARDLANDLQRYTRPPQLRHRY